MAMVNCGCAIPHPYHVSPAKPFCDVFLLTFSQPYNEADEGSDLAQGLWSRSETWAPTVLAGYVWGSENRHFFLYPHLLTCKY